MTSVVYSTDHLLPCTVQATVEPPPSADLTHPPSRLVRALHKNIFLYLSNDLSYHFSPPTDTIKWAGLESV